jgi:TRAP-type C4-dicarboxylate transport system substrate-binding protein
VIRFLRLIILVTSYSGTVYAEDVRMATMSPVGSPSRFVYNNLVENVTIQSGGAYTIEPFFNGELGPEETYFNAMRRGRIQLAAISGQAVGTAVPEYSLLRAPFLFDSFEELAFIYDNFLLRRLEELFLEKGMVHLQWTANGWENVYAQKPVRRPSDVEGYRIRVPLEPNAALFFSAAGADVIQIPFTDIIQSLQTGLINGGESTTLMYLQGGIFTEAPHLTRTHHGFSLTVFTANKKWFEGLSLRSQNILREACMKAEKAYPIMHAQTMDLLLQTRKKGVLVYDLSPQERQDWRKETLGALDKVIDQVGVGAVDFYDLIRAGKKEYAALNKQHYTP